MRWKMENGNLKILSIETQIEIRFLHLRLPLSEFPMSWFSKTLILIGCPFMEKIIVFMLKMAKSERTKFTLVRPPNLPPYLISPLTDLFMLLLGWLLYNNPDLVSRKIIKAHTRCRYVLFFLLPRRLEVGFSLWVMFAAGSSRGGR